jgi:hypothetical protein
MKKVFKTALFSVLLSVSMFGSSALACRCANCIDVLEACYDLGHDDYDCNVMYAACLG